MMRMAAEADASAIGGLLLQVQAAHADIRPDLFRRGGRKYSDEQILEILRDGKRPIFLFEDGGKVSGYVFCKIVDHEGETVATGYRNVYVDDLCVDAAARKRGIGRALMEHVFSYARKIGAYNVTLNVWCGNDTAIAFYEALGMRRQKICMEMLL